MRFQRLGRTGLSIAALATALPVVLSQPATASASSAPLIWTFDKCAASPGVWQGTAYGPGDTQESLETQLTSLRGTGSVLHVDFNWHVGETYLAQLIGTLNLDTGAVVMNGQVAEGSYVGSRVHEEGQLYDSTHSCFAGTIQVMPASGCPGRWRGPVGLGSRGNWSASVRTERGAADLEQELGVAFGVRDPVEEQVKSLRRVEGVQRPPELAHGVQLLRRQQNLLPPGAGCDEVDGGKDAFVGKGAVEPQLHVPGALEFLEEVVVHPGAGLDQRGGEDCQGSAV